MSDDQRHSPVHGPLGHRRTGEGWSAKLSPRNWRVRRKLALIVLVPTVALLAATGFAVQAQAERAQEAGAVRDLAALGQRVTSLVHLVQRERDVTAGWVASGRRDQSEVAGQRASVDVAVESYSDAVDRLQTAPGQAARLVATADNRVESLPVLRDAVSKTSMPSEAVFAVYSSIVSDLLALIGEIGRATGDRALAEPVRALDAVARTKEFASQQRGLMYALLSGTDVSPSQWQSLVSAVDQERGALTEFRSVATPEQRRRFEDAVTGSAVDRVEQIKAAAVSNQTTKPLGTDADAWMKASTTKLDLMAGVETQLLDELQRSSAAAQDRTIRNGMANVGLTLGAVLLALGAMVLMGRSLSGRLGQLRGGALEVANERLPAAIAALATVEPSDDTTDKVRVRPIGVAGIDEVGEVARAFDAVHTEALRLAREQAVLRRSLNVIFVNLARRSQSLVERLLRLLDDFERGEDDPERLQQLFEVDHLATRMRRHDESLLVLAGSDSPRWRAEPAVLGDVLRAAVAEIEDYTRVDCMPAEEVSVVGFAVTDTIHLLAELLENATWFSSGSTRVTVSSRRMPHDHGVIIEIADSGVGMHNTELDEANARLAAPPAIEAAASEKMGLYVVGRLANRHGIAVQLRRSPSGGVLALIQVPTDRLVDSPRTPVRDVTGLAVLPPGTRLGDPTLELATVGAPASATASHPFGGPTPAAASHPFGGPIRATGSHPEPSAPGDQAWPRAAAAQTPHVAEVSSAGLPVRRPLANAVPGAAGRHAMPEPGALTRRLARGGLARFQAGVESGRTPPDTTS